VFDSSAIGAYAGSHDVVYAYIDENLDAHVGELQRQDFVDLGFQEAELVPTDGHPGVWGYYDAGADKTLVVYIMYARLMRKSKS
jgi:hypothetical protein